MAFKIYKSSAGSGKTSTLVSEYLLLSLRNPSAFQSILAITFTNDAARQMKDKIINQLKMILRMDEQEKNPDYLTLHLLASLNMDIVLLKLRAKELLTNILHDYNAFAISTIDSFVHKLIRVFAVDFDLPARFETVLDADELINRITDGIIDKMGKDRALTNVVLQIVFDKMNNSKSWNPKLDISTFIKHSMTEQAYAHIKQLELPGPTGFMDISKKIRGLLVSVEKQLSDAAQSYFGLLQQAAISPTDIKGGARGLSGKFMKIQQADFSEIGSLMEKIEEILETKEWYAKSKKKAVRESIDLIIPDLEVFIKGLDAYLEKHISDYELFSEVLKHIYPLALLSEVQQLMAEIRKDEQIVHISEFNQRIADIVGNEPIPYIYARLGERYAHYMIDEFQDTSVLQWLNLLPLVSDAVAANNTSLVVGDAKQSIYRFRGGEVQLFIDLPGLPKENNNGLNPERTAILKMHHGEADLYCLAYNYRTRPEIVDFNNQLFSFIRTNAGLLPAQYTKMYEDVVQERGVKSEGGFVQVQLFDGETKDSWHQIDEQLFGIVQKLHEEYKYPYKDIAVLCRKGDVVMRSARVLMQGSDGAKGVPVISSDSVELKTSVRVQLLIYVFQLFHKPDSVLLAGKAFLSAFEAGLFHDRNVLEGLFRDGAKYGFFQVFLKAFEIKLNDIPYLISGSFYEIFEKLAIQLKIKRHDDLFLRFFFDALLGLNNERINTHDQFVQWWEEKGRKKSIVISSDTDAVRVMTVHKSKGLEFRAVIFAYADASVGNFNEYQWVELNNPLIEELNVGLVKPNKENLTHTKFASLYQEEKDKERLDFINMFYVAMTRPKDALFVLSSSLIVDGKKKSTFKESVSGILHTYFESNGIEPDAEGQYSFGALSAYQQSDDEINREKEKEMPFLPEIPEGQFGVFWDRKVDLSFAEGLEWSRGAYSTTIYGSIIHKMLSELKTKADLPHLLKRYEITLKEQGVNAELLSQAILKIVEHPDLAESFSSNGKILNERDILDANRKIVRPDRVVLFPDYFNVLEYKTGVEMEEHQQQALHYARSIAQATGINRRNIFLVYMHEDMDVSVKKIS